MTNVLSEQDIEALLNSGDPDNIERAIQYLDGQEMDVGDAVPSTGKPTTKTPQEDGDENSPALPAGILSKNGEHVIPFDVLEKERLEKQQLKQQLEDSERQLQEAKNLAELHQATSQKADLLAEQLKKAGLTPAQLPSEMTLTAKELDELEEYGDVGAVAQKLGHKLLATERLVAQLQQQLTQQAQPATAKAAAPVEDDSPTSVVEKTIDQVEGLREVMQDPSLRAQATAIDVRLRGDKAWQDKPLQERFSEVMRQMAPAILKQPAKQNKKDINVDDIDPPFSLSGIPGTTSDVTAPIEKQFEGLTEAQIQHRLNNMSSAEQDRVLAALGF